MPFVRHRLASVIELDPDQAASELVDAYTRARAHAAEAAKLLGISSGTWANYVARLTLHEALAEVAERAEREGWHHGRGRLGGRPKSKPKGRKRRS